MDGAIESGKRVAEEILEAMSQKKDKTEELERNRKV